MSMTYTDELKIVLRNEFRSVMKRMGVEFINCENEHQENDVIDAYIESMTFHIQYDHSLDYDIEKYIELSLEFNEHNDIRYIE